ncbi:MAG TPA: aldehyde ferredoxin oxidoreductase C-terminal domain-containing protein, partial [Syntrophorhabdaceae bacterium]|nr:aldehyde ferredoxin oxidoreductase C-terminal domain-containing protein [Syntrophorhabdaceae bacterium]
AFMKEMKDMMAYINFRNTNPIPDVMTILSGIGSPQEMVHTDEKWHTENFMWGNARTRRRGFWDEKINEEWPRTQLEGIKRLISCFNCPQHCGALVAYKDTPRYMAKCFGKLTYAMAAYVDSMDFAWRTLQKATEYGVDSFSTPQILAFAVELIEAGILTEKDLKAGPTWPACPTDKEGRFLWLLDRVAHREGIGEILADGVYLAARQIGNGAEAFDHNTIKRHEQLPLKLGTMDPLYYLMYATNEKISITQIEGNWPQGAFPTMEQREAFVKDWPQLPDDSWKQWLLEWEPRGEKAIPYFPTIDMCCHIVDWMEMLHNIDDACCVCAGMSSFCLKPPYHIHNYPRIISAATGLDLDEASLKKIVNRSRNLHRALNNRRGMSRKDEKPPQDHWKRRFPEIEENLMSAYYTFKGWNQDGVPTKERLNELDLGYVAEDLEKRGLLKDGQD